MSYSFRFDVVLDHLGYILQGIYTTMEVTILSVLIGILIGIFCGIGRLSRSKFISFPVAAYIELFRNTPVLVQLMWIYYCLPIFLKLNMSALTSCIIALGLCAGAFKAEIIRAGILSVPRGEIEASRALGMSHTQSLRRVILPQAIMTMLPPLVNSFISFLKFSSLVSILGVADLTYRAQSLSVSTFRPIEIFTTIALIYFVSCYFFAKLSTYVEKRASIMK